jgi:hypothetical protein
MPIYRLPTHSDGLGDLFNPQLLSLVELSGDLDLVGCHQWGTTSYPASGPGSSSPAMVGSRIRERLNSLLAYEMAERTCEQGLGIDDPWVCRVDRSQRLPTTQWLLN